tara:strand:- start:1102 stop:1335 length:234 start_codon:yes stop_codon:yes gene_type:complete
MSMFKINFFRRFKMDKYTKMILTVIAIGIIGLNIQLIERPSIFTKAHAVSDCGGWLDPCEVKITNWPNEMNVYVTNN